MSIVVSHPTGSPNLRAVLRATEGAGLLDTFWTSFALPPALQHAIEGFPALSRELGRRTFPEVPWRNMRVRPEREALRIVAKRLGRSPDRDNTLFSVDAVYNHLDRAVGQYLNRAPDISAVYAYEDGALETFRAATNQGISKIYDLPIAYWRTLHGVLAEELERAPEWAGTLHGLRDGPEKLDRKDAEIEAADTIFVASSFTKKSIEDHFGNRFKIIVAPYGAPTPCAERPTERSATAPLRIMYAGHLDQRKGISYLVAALDKLEIPWTVTLAGRRPEGSPAKLDEFLAKENVKFIGHVPHRTLLEAMATCHVFVFPSLVEGFAMVLYEAMAAGLPVITTPHTAGPDIMLEGREGHIVPIRDPDAIAAKLTSLYEDEDARFAMGVAALAAARAAPWSVYEEKIVNSLAKIRG